MHLGATQEAHYPSDVRVYRLKPSRIVVRSAYAQLYKLSCKSAFDNWFPNSNKKSGALRADFLKNWHALSP